MHLDLLYIPGSLVFPTNSDDRSVAPATVVDAYPRVKPWLMLSKL